MGRWFYGKVNRRGGKNPREHWITLDVPPIVDALQWEVAQVALRENIEKSPRNVTHEYLMRYQLVCECTYAVSCHAKVTRGVPYLYYQCNRAYGAKALPPCGAKSFRADHVDTLVWNWLVEWCKDSTDLRRKLEAYKAERARLNAPIVSLLRANEDLIAGNQAQLDRIKDMCQAKIITLEEAVDRKMRLEETVARLEHEQLELQARLGKEPSENEIESLITCFHELSQGIDEVSKDFAARRRVAELLDVRGILATEDGEQVCHASFILTEGITKRLVLPKRGKVLSVANTSICSRSGWTRAPRAIP